MLPTRAIRQCLPEGADESLVETDDVACEGAEARGTRVNGVDDDVVLVEHDDAGHDEREAASVFEPCRAEVAGAAFGFAGRRIGEEPEESLRGDGLGVVV